MADRGRSGLSTDASGLGTTGFQLTVHINKSWTPLVINSFEHTLNGQVRYVRMETLAKLSASRH